jgi:hypothetical protein
VIFRKRAIRLKQSVVNILVLVAVLALLLYVTLQLFGRSSTMVSTQRAQVVTDVAYTYGKGYIFRDETVVFADDGIVDYLAPDGARIGVGQAYADVYPTADLKASEIVDLQSRIDELSLRISMLSSGVGGKTEISDLASVSESLEASYYAYIDSVANGDVGAADEKGEILLDAIVDYRVITGRDGVAENIISSLEAEKRALLEKLGASKRLLSEDKGFYFFHSADGYEEIFTSSAVADLTAEKLDALVEREPKEYTGAIGKAAHTAKWYIAIPVSEAESFTFTESLTYDITFNESNRTIDMLLEKIYVGEDGAYLLFSCYDLSLVPAFSRAQSVKIRTGSVSGYKIPAEALTKLYNENGVFILVGSRVEFRRVTVIADGDRYYIVNTYASDSEEGAVSDIPYLNANDLIITSGNDLYDGKSLD